MISTTATTQSNIITSKTTENHVTVFNKTSTSPTSSSSEVFRTFNDTNYSVSTEGHIRNDKSGKILNPAINSAGYRIVSLHDGFGNVKQHTVHGLVAQTFLGHVPVSRSIIVDHKDNNPMNNSVSNLQIITQRENCSKDKINGDYSSNIVGVHHCDTRDKYIASIRYVGAKLYLGGFKSEEVAGTVYGLAKSIIQSTVIDTEEKLSRISELKEEFKKIK